MAFVTTPVLTVRRTTFPPPLPHFTEMVDRWCHHGCRFVHPKQGQIKLSMPFFFLTEPVSAREPLCGGPDGCVRGGRTGSGGVGARREGSGCACAMCVCSGGTGPRGLCIGDGGRVGGISTTSGTGGLDGPCDRRASSSFRPGGPPPSGVPRGPPPRCPSSNEPALRDPTSC